jgi:Ca2+-binding RTX toxin-like protein
LIGNGLNNTLSAGIGNNILNGGSGTDTVSYSYASSAVTVDLSNTSIQTTGGSGSDTLISIEDLVGSGYNDTLTGSAGNNALYGGAGNDRLTGGGGKDFLVGGAGNDTFAFSTLSDSGITSTSWDVIHDFLSGTDKIDLSKLDANTAASGDNAFTQVIGSTAAFTAAGQLKLNGGVLYGNIDTDADAEFAIQLVGVTSASLADFIA